MTVGLCLLVWNELQGCRADIPKISMELFDEVFALDGGSTDGTIEYISSLGIPTVAQSAPGYDRAYIQAFQQTSCDALVIFHPKGTIDPTTLASVVEPLRQGIDLVIASRNSHGARNEEDASLWRPRKWFVLSLSALTALLWWRGGGPIMWDVLHGFRGMKKEAFFAMDPIVSSVSMDLQMVARAYRTKMSRLEVPVVESPRQSGNTHFKAVPTGLKLFTYLRTELKRQKPQPYQTKARLLARNQTISGL